MGVRWGIDLGGTKIEGVILPEGSVEPVARLRVPTEAHLGYDHILSQVAKVVDELQVKSGLERPNSIGIGTPGVTDPDTGLLKNANTTCLIGQPVQRALSERLGCEALLANDANCFALAEATLGCAKGYPTVFGVIMGTGVGGGLVVNSQVLNGRHGIAGEWGHNLLEVNGLPCYCGKTGCVETVLSGPFLTRWYESRSGRSLPLKEIVELARSGQDEVAVATLDRLIDYVGRALSVVVNIFDPHAIVLGGGVGNIDELYTRGLESLSTQVFNEGFHGALLKPTLGDSAGVFGAAMLVE
jgi:predicted NBD/HSP70 family sugar kinase